MKAIMSFLIISFLSICSNAALITGYAGNMLAPVSVVIANGATESSLINLKGFVLVGITTPAALTGTALTFESCSSTGTGCIPVKTSTSGTALSYTVTTSSYYAITPTDFQGVQYLKIKSGSAEGAARTLVISLKGF